MINMIAFDADDTLWDAEVHYQNAQEELRQILSPWKESKKLDDILLEVEVRNLPLYGYGAKAFVLSMIEAALQISSGEIGGDSIEKILSIGRSMLKNDISLRPKVEDTVKNLSMTHRLMIITKGDLLDQTAKVERSDLASYFSAVEVVNEKTSATYSSILKKYSLDIETFLMVGNSLRSDILPILALGGRAVHIPADTTWELEMASEHEKAGKEYFELEHIGQLPDLISEIS